MPGHTSIPGSGLYYGQVTPGQLQPVSRAETVFWAISWSAEGHVPDSNTCRSSEKFQGWTRPTGRPRRSVQAIAGAVRPPRRLRRGAARTTACSNTPSRTFPAKKKFTPFPFWPRARTTGSAHVASPDPRSRREVWCQRGTCTFRFGCAASACQQSQLIDVKVAWSLLSGQTA